MDHPLSPNSKRPHLSPHATPNAFPSRSPVASPARKTYSSPAQSRNTFWSPVSSGALPASPQSQNTFASAISSPSPVSQSVSSPLRYPPPQTPTKTPSRHPASPATSSHPNPLLSPSSTQPSRMPKSPFSQSRGSLWSPKPLKIPVKKRKPFTTSVMHFHPQHLTCYHHSGSGNRIYMAGNLTGPGRLIASERFGRNDPIVACVKCRDVVTVKGVYGMHDLRWCCYCGLCDSCRDSNVCARTYSEGAAAARWAQELPLVRAAWAAGEGNVKWEEERREARVRAPHVPNLEKGGSRSSSRAASRAGSHRSSTPRSASPSRASSVHGTSLFSPPHSPATAVPPSPLPSKNIPASYTPLSSLKPTTAAAAAAAANAKSTQPTTFLFTGRAASG